MSRIRFVLPTLCVAFLLVTLTARAESTWKLPDLNPFNNAPKSKTAKKSTSLFKLPELSWPGKGGGKRSSTNKPSTWNRVSNGTKNFFSKTKEVLTPWDNSSKKTGNSSIRNRFGMTTKKKEKSSSFFTGWLTKEEEPKRARTVSEWLSQPRP